MQSTNVSTITIMYTRAVGENKVRITPLIMPFDLFQEHVEAGDFDEWIDSVYEKARKEHEYAFRAE